MKITVYDGSQTIGGSKIHIQEGENGLFLDFGMNFAKYAQYYEEFISERPSRGIHDLWKLGLIPKLNIYRKDLIPQDLTGEVSQYPKIPVNAVLISHAHLDHVGNITLLDENIPIVGSPTTMIILKALRDTSRGSHMGMELPYYTPKKPSDSNPYVLEAKREIKHYINRNIILTDELSESGLNFLSWLANVELAKSKGRTKSIQLGKVQHLKERELGFEVHAYPVDHSIYGALAYVVEGNTAIAYTGDFRLHGKNRGESRKFVKAARSASVLITEGTRAGREDDENVSEEEVYKNAKAIVEEAKGLVVADFSARNFERLESFKKIAEETGRELVVTTKDAYFLHALGLVDGKDYISGLRVYRNSKAKPEKWEEWIFLNYPGIGITPEEVGRDRENYILCFSFYDMPHLLDVMPEGGVYIYSSSEAFTEEQTFSFLRLWNWLQYFGFEVRGFSVDDDGKPIFEGSLHASGHISKEELERVIDKIDPDYVIPVHTENPEWFKGQWDKKVITLKDGESWEV
ncbi:MBL fold metallo-hydrolase [Thermococcus celericrescens]|uniref:MBL fold metallo-hydrolase n=1 Tax=Thermococcus celericrescens TaxID=227598 RepID=A0A100XYQ6_9EURY|nr:ribonuclease J [Thermococcus celericrescens]KUH34010.1 MBL fold metallo-hydrolase [Thermococcus celericrescens]